ncbi:hypothetical protein C1H76_2296 [Elsinoe australis]|uniref:Rhodopsin domain-containing protein n=1 Tax=Elsinoe australis TaxID=40998 RepID=A0A4U7B9P7_9PEZI|nr:hypothetical protein C1H76_2296 [Elsinoe australis]
MSTTSTATEQLDLLDSIAYEFDRLNKVNAICMVFICSAVFVRVWVRSRMIKVFGKEDWTMVVTFVVYLAQASMLFAASVFGKQAFTGRPQRTDIYNQLSRASNAAYAIVLVTLKISVGFFFLRILSHRRAACYFIYVVVMLHTIVGLVYFGFSGFTCVQLKDVQAFTESCSVQDASTAVFTTVSIVDITTDFILALMGIYVLWNARLPLITKVSACVLLAVGTSGGVVSAVRLRVILEPTNPEVYMKQLLDSRRWVVLELATGMIASNLTMIRPLFHAILIRLKILTTSKNRTGSDVEDNNMGGLPHHKSSRVTRHVIISHASYSPHTEPDEWPLNDVSVDMQIRKETEVVVDEDNGNLESSSSSNTPEQRLREL